MANSLEKIECDGGYYYKHPSAVVEDGAQVGVDTKIWDDVHLFPTAVVGSHCVLGAGVHIEDNAELGSHSKVQRGVVLYNGVKAGDYVFFGPNATTTNDRNPRAFGPWELSETIIGTGATIGANATLIAGNEIGPLALVGAGSVVTKPVEACQVVAGNPAKFIGWVDVGGSVISRETTMPPEVEEILKDPLFSIATYLETIESDADQVTD